MKRVLARCHKFEETGKSCFSEPSLRDVIFAAPRNAQPETVNSQPVPSVSGLLFYLTVMKIPGNALMVLKCFCSVQTHVFTIHLPWCSKYS